MSVRTGRIGIAAVAGAWVVSLAAAFLLNRGEDVGRLVALLAASLGAISKGPVWGLAGLLASVAGVTIGALIGVAWYGLGHTIQSRIGAGAKQRAGGGAG